uniref:Uncharacterized protein n=1 Tax=Proteus vulgaris TaxID=585 RepID=Q8KK70_PROVU|nr:hypothetical protein [Proteus vulgaris]
MLIFNEFAMSLVTTFCHGARNPNIRAHFRRFSTCWVKLILRGGFAFNEERTRSEISLNLNFFLFITTYSVVFYA